jgi:S-formylglutathione hydrolase
MRPGVRACATRPGDTMIRSAASTSQHVTLSTPSQSVAAYRMQTMQLISEHRCFAGRLGYYQHAADTTRCEMRLSLYLPPQAEQGPVPLVWWLSGLTCSEENFTTKAGAYRDAAELGLAIVAPDTSPRGADVPDDPAADLGQAAGFYVDATQPPWHEHFQMASYIAEELPDLMLGRFPLRADAQGICGHSMGGHGALTLALRDPQRYRSVSALAPIVAPSEVSWGRKALSAYLGDDESAWARYDATRLIQRADRAGQSPILIDQGEADPFLAEQLRPELFAAACQQAGQQLKLRYQPGYDHGYFFVATFIGDHLRHHARLLAD